MTAIPNKTFAMECTVTRDKTGATTVFLKSPMLEDVFVAMSGGRTTGQNFENGSVALHNPETGQPGVFNRSSVRVYTGDALRFSGDSTNMYWSGQPLYDGRPSMTSLAVVGLRHGITWRIESPMTSKQLRAYSEALRDGVRNIFESVRAVRINVNIPVAATASKAA